LILKTSIHQVKHNGRNILFAVFYDYRVTIIKYEMEIKGKKKLKQSNPSSAVNELGKNCSRIKESMMGMHGRS